MDDVSEASKGSRDSAGLCRVGVGTLPKDISFDLVCWDYSAAQLKQSRVSSSSMSCMELTRVAALLARV
jgi:hypothetical protein